MPTEKTDHYRDPVEVTVTDGRGSGPDHALGMETVWRFEDFRGPDKERRVAAIHFPDYWLSHLAEKINQVIEMRRKQAEALAADVAAEYRRLGGEPMPEKLSVERKLKASRIAARAAMDAVTNLKARIATLEAEVEALRDELKTHRAERKQLAEAVVEIKSVLADYQHDYGPGIACLPAKSTVGHALAERIIREEG